MLAQITENVGVEGVTITYAMMVLTIGVALFVELIKVILSRFAWFTADLKKPFLPLLSIGVTMAVFRATGQTSWLLAGVILGWSASGGYTWVAGMLEKLGLKTKAVVPVLLACSLLTGGCSIFAGNPKAELLASQKTFSATVDSLTALQQAGKFTPQETAQLTILIHQGQQYLDQWHEAVKVGQPRPDIIAAFQVVLDSLIQTNIQKGGAS